MKSFLYRIAAIKRMHSWKDVYANKKSKTGKKSFSCTFEHLITLSFTFNLDKLSSIAASSYRPGWSHLVSSIMILVLLVT